MLTVHKKLFSSPLYEKSPTQVETRRGIYILYNSAIPFPQRTIADLLIQQVEKVKVYEMNIVNTINYCIYPNSKSAKETEIFQTPDIPLECNKSKLIRNGAWSATAKKGIARSSLTCTVASTHIGGKTW